MKKNEHATLETVLIVKNILISRILENTSILTATTLIYAIGAGITAAAGTRLALQ